MARMYAFIFYGVKGEPRRKVEGYQQERPAAQLGSEAAAPTPCLHSATESLLSLTQCTELESCPVLLLR